MERNTYILDNGLRIVHCPTDAQVVYASYRVGAGTRDEAPGEEGLAHLCEHMAFKGTATRKAWQVMTCLDRVGGDLNAFTTKDDTTFHATILRDHTRRALDLLTDLVFNSTSPDAELEKEREVVCDEIESYNDSPAELIYDDFENVIFSGHPLGHSILGEAEQVRQYTSSDVQRFMRRHYRPENAVLFVMGASLADIKSIPAFRGQTLRPLNATRRQQPEEASRMQALTDSRTIVRNRGTHQAHVMIGTKAYAISHPLRMALYLFNNIIAGPAMNARLNMSLRERRGLVYTVEGALTSYQDTGTWSVYFGCDPADTDRCLRLVHGEIERFRQHPLTERQLNDARRQLKGQLGVAMDNREAVALDISKSFLHQGIARDVADLFPLIDSVTPEQIRQAVDECCRSLLTIIYQ